MGNNQREIYKIGGKMKKFFLATCYLLLATNVFSVTTSFWKIKDFEQCKLTNIMLDKDRFASLAPEVNTVWENPEVYVWAMLELGNILYVATGAEGKVYKIEGSESSLLLDAKEAGVFSLATSNGKIYAGTSPNGRIFVIDKDGTSKVFEDTHQKYIWKIVFDEKGNLYAATGTTGLILKISKQGKIDTFYTTQQMNVSFLAYFDSHFYAGTGEEGLLFKIDHQGKGFCLYDASEPEITGVVKIDTLLFVSATSDTQSSIYRIFPDNRVSKIWNTKSPIRGLQSSGTKLLVAAGTRIYRIDSDGKGTLIAELPTNISCIMNNWIATSEVGKVYKIAEELADKGIIESTSYDTKSVSKWGKLEFKPTEGIEFMTRTGNTKEPDHTWDEWKSLDPDFKINSPSARFIQWKATLSSKTSKLKEVKIPYLTQNETPEISEIKFVEDEEGKENPGAKKIIWKAHDPNEDKLTFNLFFKLTDEEHWTLLKESFKDTLYSIDPKSFPDGEYLVKVEASDSPSNPLQYALTAKLISEPYLIDNTPPEIKIIGIKDKFLFFEAQDNFNIKSCRYSLNGGEWQIAFPVDRLFDSKIERFKVETGLARKVVIKVQDTYGNTTLKSKLIE